jgi:NAD(P)-dependent dehydrogenase (short-subunit alcohol dehydrogenase family)
MQLLADKVVIITGGSRGIGAAIAAAALDAGAKVAIASRKQADLDRAAAELAGKGEVLAVACHTGKAEDVDALFAAAIERFGRVDGAVNNAATNPYFGPLLDTPDGAIDKTIEVNLKGYLYVAGPWCVTPEPAAAARRWSTSPRWPACAPRPCRGSTA